MKPDICIYHAPCADGFTAAWAVYQRWPGIEFHPGVYGEAAPDVAGKHVLIVDFSYKRPVLEALGQVAASITILDHHKTAEEDLQTFAVLNPCSYEDIDQLVAATQPGLGNIRATFNMNKSGAMLAWDFCHPNALPPRLVQHVQDRDLWRFKLEGTREIQAVIFSHPYLFDTWDELVFACEDDDLRAGLIEQGAAIERKHHKDIGELLDQTMRYMVIGGFRVPVANLPYTLASDAANVLAEGNAFGACYFDRNDGKRVFSLRAQDGGEDVSKIAAAYGGGGHAKAAGFQAPAGWEGEQAF